MPASVLDVDKDFNMLSLADLLTARELYHLHLTAKQNVVGTAIGRYLIRKSDPWPQARSELTAHDTRAGRTRARTPRTLENSEVRPYSWPCVLVFVDTWMNQDDLARRDSPVDPQDFVPSTLYMPDGTRVPVCVVHAPIQERTPDEPIAAVYPKQFVGGGYPLVVETQESSHVASIGCLVSDGHTVYALTNRHVVGEAGEPIYSLIDGVRVRIGESSGRQLTRRPFEEVYGGWPSKDVYINLDAGLVRIDDINRWTTQVYGIGQIGKLADLSVRNISLRLIGCPLVAYGAASGRMTGAIAGLFYRFKSLGGYEYVADFLIGPRAGADALPTRPGDSGTLWLLQTDEPDALPLPIGLQWGGQRFVTAGKNGVSPFALATCLSTICNALDVDLVRDWNLDINAYWGAVGHYTIATKAIDFLAATALGQLMSANRDRISFDVAHTNTLATDGLSKKPFVPLADVPDLVWKTGDLRRGGPTSPEHPNHFADMDRRNSAGKTLLQICKSPSNVDPAVWLAYYNDPKVADKTMGLLPFRVWQIYDEMVRYVRAKQYTEFVCAAGILSHYVGDACQPLHISYMYDGDPADTQLVSRTNPAKKVVEQILEVRGAGCHSAYEDDMVNVHIGDINAGLAPAKRGRVTRFTGGQAAAVAVVKLMAATFEAIKPQSIVNAFVPLKASGAKPRVVADALWAKVGDDTISVMTDGARCLALLWDSAWKEGGGPTSSATKWAAIDPAKLAALYQRPSFLPAYRLDQIGAILKPKNG